MSSDSSDHYDDYPDRGQRHVYVQGQLVACTISRDGKRYLHAQTDPEPGIETDDVERSLEAQLVSYQLDNVKSIDYNIDILRKERNEEMTDTTTQLELPDLDQGLSPTQRRVLRRAIDVLDNLPVKYAVLTPDGEEFKRGEWELVRRKPAKAKRERKYPHGAVRGHVIGFIGSLEPGQVVLVPVTPYDVESVQGSISAYGAGTWGKGTCITARTKDNMHVEVYRAV